MTSKASETTQSDALVVRRGAGSKRQLSSRERRKYLQKFKNKLQSPKVKFIASMKMAFKCLLKNERFVVHLPLPYYVRIINEVFKGVSSRFADVEERYGSAINSHSVNALRNKIAVKNAFMKYVVNDSLDWASNMIKQEIGEFGNCQYVIREYIEEIDMIEEAQEVMEVKEKKDEKPEDKPKQEENVKVKRTYINPENEEFINNPIHKNHLSSTFSLIKTKN